ncbi:hypothetical protein DFH06DRAFT_1204987 [Mycena polygramma]|nr:hypothetical protein DFH06DRAFT_1204987 [Mycena polygramma]
MAAKFHTFDNLKYESEDDPDSWPTWESKCKAALVISGYWGYITGRGHTAPAKQILDSSTPPVLIDNPRWEDWLDENLLVLSCIRLRLGDTDIRLIKDEEIASVAWASLKSAHLPSGALSQLTILQQALALRFTRDVPLATTSEKLQTLVNAFFAVRPPTQDEWTSILFLNAMAGPDFKDARSSLDTLLSAGKLASSSVVARIKHEQVRINGEMAEAASQEASFAAFSKRYEQMAPKPEYPNGQGPCKNPQCKSRVKQFHDWDHCYGPGGRMKAPKGKGKRGGSSPKEKAKLAAAANSSDESDDQAAFASDSAGYRSFFADANAPRGETASFDWSTISPDVAHLARSRPTVLAALILYLDTGATSSICPILKYFTKITPCMRTVSGVGGSSIKAIGCPLLPRSRHHPHFRWQAL